MKSSISRKKPTNSDRTPEQETNDCMCSKFNDIVTVWSHSRTLLKSSIPVKLRRKPPCSSWNFLWSLAVSKPLIHQFVVRNHKGCYFWPAIVLFCLISAKFVRCLLDAVKSLKNAPTACSLASFCEGGQLNHWTSKDNEILVSVNLTYLTLLSLTNSLVARVSHRLAHTPSGTTVCFSPKRWSSLS